MDFSALVTVHGMINNIITLIFGLIGLLPLN